MAGNLGTQLGGNVFNSLALSHSAFNWAKDWPCQKGCGESKGDFSLEVGAVNWVIFAVGLDSCCWHVLEGSVGDFLLKIGASCWHVLGENVGDFSLKVEGDDWVIFSMGLVSFCGWWHILGDNVGDFSLEVGGDKWVIFASGLVTFCGCWQVLGAMAISRSRLKLTTVCLELGLACGAM